MTVPVPYKSTPMFDESTLPAGLRKEHRTKAGVRGSIRIYEGRVLHTVLNPLAETILDTGNPGLVLPE